jgi:hypothetical protein
MPRAGSLGDHQHRIRVRVAVPDGIQHPVKLGQYKHEYDPTFNDTNILHDAYWVQHVYCDLSNRHKVRRCTTSGRWCCSEKRCILNKGADTSEMRGRK